MIVAFVICCCSTVSFFLKGIESGLLSVDPVRLRQNVKRRVPAALRLNRLLKHPERLLVTVLFFTNAADILGLLLLTWELVRSFGYAGFFFALVIAFPVYLFLLSVLPIALPAISVPCFGTPGRRIGIFINPALADIRGRRAPGKTLPAKARGETCSAVCRPRRAEADHSTKCT